METHGVVVNDGRKDKTRPCYILQLPDEMLDVFVSHVDVKDYDALARTCRRTHAVLSRPEFHIRRLAFACTRSIEKRWPYFAAIVTKGGSYGDTFVSPLSKLHMVHYRTSMDQVAQRFGVEHGATYARYVLAHDFVALDNVLKLAREKHIPIVTDLEGWLQISSSEGVRHNTHRLISVSYGKSFFEREYGEMVDYMCNLLVYTHGWLPTWRDIELFY